MLAVLKRQGVPFDRAWKASLTKVRYPHETIERREYKTVLEEHRPIYEDAYYNRGDVPGGPALLALVAALIDQDDDHHETPVRWPGDGLAARPARPSERAAARAKAS